MAGLVAAKQYDWKDSNLALFGSDTERNVKKEAAETEPAWARVRDVTSSALMLWRIRNFKLEPVDKDDIGRFFSGDSYIILKVDKVGDELLYDAHFWIGKESTQDEYGTAAYKTVELDTFLDDKAVQHREVDGFESEQFKNYFTNFETLEGGYASGFKHVEPEKFQPRILVFHAKDRNHVELREVTFSKQSLNSDDVFILDFGDKAYQWNGGSANKDEKFGAGRYLQHLEETRNGRCKTEVYEDGDDDFKKILDQLPDKPPVPKVKQEVGQKYLYKLSDQSGSMEMNLVCEGRAPKSAINNNDVYFIDSGSALFVYIGTECSRKEKMDALSRAHEYLKGTNHPYSPITVVSGGRQSKELEKVLD